VKITHIEIENLIGIRRADIRVDRPVLVATGPNGAGKSSLQECIRLALLAHSPRVDLKKDYGRLVHEGAKAGMVALNTSEGAISVHITAEGKVTDSAKGRDSQAFIEYVLNPPLFASQPVAERRSMLYRLLGLDLTPEGIKARLIAKGCDEKKVEDMAPMLRAGFESAQKHAASQATMAKGAFKATTGGETWGAQKGSTYRAPTPPFSGDDAAELAGLDKRIAEHETELGAAQQRLGIAEHEARQAGARVQTIEHLRAKAKTYAEHASLVAAAEKELERLKGELSGAQQKAGQKPQDWHSKLTCPLCQGAVMDSDDGESLVPWQDPPAVTYDPEAAARIPDLQKSILTQQRVLERHKGNQREADEAAIQLKALEDETKPASGETKAADPETIRATVETLRQQIETKRARQRALLDAQRKLDEADAKTKQARQHHADVLAWDAIAKALSPDGIPSEILGEALGPFNDRVRVSAGDTGWPLVELDRDMQITYGGRPLALCSESEQFRANAVIAEAISFLSGLQFLALDRADLLDAEGLAQLMRWADTLAYEKDIETLLVLATTDGEPEGLTDLMQSVRIEAGEIVQPEQREAA